MPYLSCGSVRLCLPLLLNACFWVLQALANENIALEERVRELRVKEIRLTKQLDDARAECESMCSQVESLKKQNERVAEATQKIHTDIPVAVPVTDLKSSNVQPGGQPIYPNWILICSVQHVYDCHDLEQNIPSIVTLEWQPRVRALSP